jgi:hypothetical protein
LIKEARKEAQKLADTLANLEHMVRIQPDNGVFKIEDRMVKPILSLDQIWPLTGWLLSLYESFYMIGYAGIGRDYAKKVTAAFSNLITKVNTVGVSLG